MDYVVLTTNGDQIVVAKKQLRTIKSGDELGLGTSVKVKRGKKWCYGRIIHLFGSDDQHSNSSSDNMPLAHYKKSQSAEKQNDEEISDESADDFHASDDSYSDPAFGVTCEMRNCEELSTSKCTNCNSLVCESHREKEGASCMLCNPTYTETTVHTDLPSPREVSYDRDTSETVTLTLLQNVSDCHETSGLCEIEHCLLEVFAACVRCSKLVCFTHLHEQPCCSFQHGEHPYQRTSIMENIHTEENSFIPLPEDFVVDGAPSEEPRPKQKRTNKQKIRKELRNAGKQYITSAGKIAPPRQLKNRCAGVGCKKTGKRCMDFSDSNRQSIFDEYWETGNLQTQREFIARHVKTIPTKRTYTNSSESRRQNTNIYTLALGENTVTTGENTVAVCKLFFLNTLGISEKTMRTSLNKVKPSTGVMDTEKRGGKQPERIVFEEIVRERVQEHINKFPRAESHYCRTNTTREYLCPDLTLKKMYTMYLQYMKDSTSEIASFITYKRVFKSMNLSIMKPKKDQCSLCNGFRQGDEITKARLQERYDSHILNKKKVRSLKEMTKQKAILHPTDHVTAVFDLQQVIYLPQSRESAIFYKRRLAAYNFTIYNLADNDCTCNFWHEAISRRGACEIATFVYNFLLTHDRNQIKTIDLFADGCAGQNKNSIMASMLLYFINISQHTSQVSLKFFEPNHGQSEGDSAHSAIGTAIKHAGELFVPSQLVPVITLARRTKSYNVKEIHFSDILDFKSFSKGLRLLSIRKDDQTGAAVDWTKMVEYRVTKENPNVIYFKNSHDESDYRSISIKRQTRAVFQDTINMLNVQPTKISSAKYADLMTLCTGDTSVIRLEEYVNFYKNLPHD